MSPPLELVDEPDDVVRQVILYRLVDYNHRHR